MNQKNLAEPQARPTVITVFAILTLISGGFGLVAALVPDGIFNGSGMPEVPRDDSLRAIDALLSILKVTGAIFLLQMRKIGFGIYTVAEIGVVILMVINLRKQLAFFEQMTFQKDLFMDPATFVIFGVGASIVLSVVWIAVYGSQMAKMR